MIAPYVKTTLCTAVPVTGVYATLQQSMGDLDQFTFGHEPFPYSDMIRLARKIA